MIDSVEFVKAGQVFGAGIAMGLGAIGAALGEGMAGGYANVSIGRRPGNSSGFTRNMLVAQAVAETSAIFALMVSVLLLFTDMSGRGACAWASAVGAGLCMGLGSFGSGIGAGYPGSEAIWGVSRQPETSSQMTTTMLVGQAVCQTPAIFAMVIAFMLIFTDTTGLAVWPYSACLLGAGISMGFGAIGSGWGGGATGGAACRGYARQPNSRGSLMTLMLVGQAVAQTPAIFALLVAIMLINIGPETGNLMVTMAMLGAGISMGLGAIGSGLGNGVNAEAACDAVSAEPVLSRPMMTFMLVGQAVGQTPVIFALLVSFILIFKFMTFTAAFTLASAVGLLSAGIAMGFGAIGPGYGNGLTGASACRALANHPEEQGLFMRTMLVAQAVSQSTAIYALVVAFCLIFVVI